MARRYKPGDVKWVAYPDGIARVEVEERGSRGFTFRDGKKPENPYIVSENDGERYVVGEADLHDNPVEASKAVAKMRSKLGMSELGSDDEDEEVEEDDELEENDFDDEDDEDDDEEFEDEDDELEED